MAGSRLFYSMIGLALLLFFVGFFSIFHASITAAGQVRLWQETEPPLKRQPATMQPGNRWDAEFSGVLEEQSVRDLLEIFELVGVVDSDKSHALIRIKGPKNARKGQIERVALGADLAGGVKVTHIEESRITLKLGDEQIVLSLYENFERENEQSMEKRVDSQR
jgi:hypothetical protein